MPPVPRSPAVGGVARAGPAGRPRAAAQRRHTPPRAAGPAAHAGVAAATPALRRRSSWSATSPGSRSRRSPRAMKIEPNYLYRVMPKLTSDGLVTRDGQGWHAVARAE